MTLNDLLDTYRRHCESQWSDADRIKWVAYLERARRAGVFARALKVGETVPDLLLSVDEPKPGQPDGDSLHQWLAKGPVLVKFVAGRGCAYSVLELRAYQRALPAFREQGVKVLVFSGDPAREAGWHRQQDELGFPVIADPDHRVASRFGVSLAIDGLAAQVLPATFLIGTDRRVHYAFVDPDWRHRADPSLVLQVLRDLQPGGRGGLHQDEISTDEGLGRLSPA